MIVSDIVESEINTGISKDTIIIGGFSQGGAISLYNGVTNGRYGGILCLSAYLPLIEEIPKDKLQNVESPLLMCHGVDDQVIPIKKSKTAFETIKGKNLKYKEYQMGHNADYEELQDVVKWIASLETTSKL